MLLIFINYYTLEKDKNAINDKKENIVEKDYFKKYKNTDPNIKCANLFFLMFIAKTVDEDTASTFAKQVLEKKVNWEVIETLLGTYLGY